MTDRISDRITVSRNPYASVGSRRNYTYRTTPTEISWGAVVIGNADPISAAAVTL